MYFINNTVKTKLFVAYHQHIRGCNEWVASWIALLALFIDPEMSPVCRSCQQMQAAYRKPSRLRISSLIFTASTSIGAARHGEPTPRVSSFCSLAFPGRLRLTSSAHVWISFGRFWDCRRALYADRHHPGKVARYREERFAMPAAAVGSDAGCSHLTTAKGVQWVVGRFQLIFKSEMKPYLIDLFTLSCCAQRSGLIYSLPI